MAGGRIRSIKPEWAEDEMLGALPDSDRVLSVVLITLADDYGNGRANPMYLASNAWPYSRDPLESLRKATEGLSRLTAGGFVRVYEVAGQAYYAITNWQRHQKVSHPGQPRVPGPENATREGLAKSSGGSPEILVPDLDLSEGSSGEGVGSPARAREAETPPPRPIPVPHSETVTHSDAQDAFSRLRDAAGHGPYRASQREYQRVSDLASFATSQGTTRAERFAALDATILGYLRSVADDWCRERGYPLSGMRDFGQCLAAGRRLPQERPAAPETPRSRLEAERRRIVALRGSGAWTQKSHDEQRVAVERLEQIERELAEMRRAS